MIVLNKPFGSHYMKTLSTSLRNTPPPKKKDVSIQSTNVHLDKSL